MEQPVSANPKPTQSLYSPAGVLIALLLCITFLVLTRFLADDLRETSLGKQPSFSETVQSVDAPLNQQSQRSTNYIYKGDTYEDFGDANKVFDKEVKLPYQINAILIKVFIFVPLFLLSVYLVFGLKIASSAYKLATGAFFIAMAIDMINILTDLGLVLYAYNQRLAIYAIGGVLIAVFLATIAYIQSRVAKHNSTPGQPTL